MDHSLKDRTVCIVDPDCARLPLVLVFSEHSGAGGFGVYAGARSRIGAANQEASPTPARMLDDDGR
ncbi:MAG: hypothetical protein C5S47_07510 [Candidatus Methanogasteraceae archaeon]|nr:MAG: hypothetical protein C5S47_07510 [ANME-2 cluster archaeon]